MKLSRATAARVSSIPITRLPLNAVMKGIAMAPNPCSTTEMPIGVSVP